MEIITDIASLRARLKHESSIGFVPTMGNLHEGHLSLVRAAQQKAHCIVVSIFVNRLQFGPTEDFDRYPRTLADDCELLENQGVDIAFVPAEKSLYPVKQEFMLNPPTDSRHAGRGISSGILPGRFNRRSKASEHRSARCRRVW